MLVVVAILGLMVGLLVARGPQRSATLELSAAANEVAQTLRGARARAIASDADVVVRVNAAAHAFAVDGGTAHALPAALSVSLTAAADQSVGTVAGILFAPDGSSSGGEIKLVQGAWVMRVDVSWLTGRVSLAEVQVPQ